MQHAADRACVLLCCIRTFGPELIAVIDSGTACRILLCSSPSLNTSLSFFTFGSDRNVTVRRCRLIEITAHSTCLPVRCREFNLVCPSIILLIWHFPFLLVPSQLTAAAL